MYVAKTKTLISCAVTVQLICAFVFAYAKSRFSHEAAQMSSSFLTDRPVQIVQNQTRLLHYLHLSRVVRKPAFCICENKDADQLRGNREADQRLCFRYTDSTIPVLPQSEISSLLTSSRAVQPGLCGTWSETPKIGFLTMRLILSASF